MNSCSEHHALSYRDYLDAHARPRLQRNPAQRRSRRQWGTLILEITHFCPVGCAHCHIASGPTSRLHLTEDQIITSIHAFSRYPDAQYVFCTGGEPFSEINRLKTALNTIRECNLLSYTLTSGSWATSLSQADRILDQLGPIDLFAASIDSYHLAKLRIDQPLNAIDAAIRRGSSTFISVGHLGSSDPVRKQIVDAITDRFGTTVPVIYYPLLARGAGSDLVEFEGRELERPASAPCFSVGAPLVTASGAVVACCQSTQANAVRSDLPTPLALGNCHDLDAALKRYLDNSFITAIRTIGPAQTADALNLNVPADFSSWDICRACEHLQATLPETRIEAEINVNATFAARVEILDEILSRGSASRLKEYCAHELVC